MLRKVLAFAAIAMFLVGVGCANGTNPVTPDKDSQTLEEYYNSFDMSNPAVAEYTYTDFDGNVLATGLIGQNEDGLYLIENRGAQIDVNLAPLSLVWVWVTYNNPAGTIPSGVNAGLPYYYIGQTIDYDINIRNWLWFPIGQVNPCKPWQFTGPAELTVEMHYASFNAAGEIVVGGLLPGDPIFYWEGVVSPGYQTLNDTFHIVPGTVPGLDVTTAELRAPVFFGIFEIIFFDGIAGVWDPI